MNKTYIGVVEDRNDPLGMGRVRVRVFGKHNILKEFLPTESLPWAVTIQSTDSAGTSGIGKTPVGMVEGTNVLIIYRDKWEQFPLVIGVIPGIPGYEDPQSIDNSNVMGNGSTATTDAMTRFGDPNSYHIPESQKWMEESLKSSLDKFGITAPATKRMMITTLIALAEVKGDPKYTLEPSSYSSVPELMKFQEMKTKTKSEVEQYLNMSDRSKFFEAVYGYKTAYGQLIGNKSEGDAVRYAGAGLIPLVGKSEYKLVTEILQRRGYDIDLVKEPLKVIDREFYAPVALAVMESRNMIHTDNISNPQSFFDNIVSKLPLDQYEKDQTKEKFESYNRNVEPVKSPIIDAPGNTSYFVGNPVIMSESEVKKIENNQKLISANIIDQHMKDNDLSQFRTQKEKWNNEVTTLRNKEIEARKEYSSMITELKNEITTLAGEAKEAVNKNLAKINSFNSNDSIITKTYDKLADEVKELKEVGGGFLDDIKNELSDITSAVNDQIAEINGILDDVKTSIDESIGVLDDIGEGIGDLIDTALSASGLDALGIEGSDLDFYSEYITEAKRQADAAYFDKIRQADELANSLMNKVLFDKVGELSDKLAKFGSDTPTGFASLLSKFGINPYSGLLANGRIQDLLEKLYSGIQKKIGFSPFQLRELSNIRIENEIRGFCDPNRKYPLRHLVGTPATNKIARGQLNNTIFSWQMENQKTDIPIAGAASSDDVQQKVSVPVITPRGQYPYTQVHNSESGHIRVVDDSPGSEMTAEYHRSGTGTATGPDGTKTTHVIRDDYEVIAGNKVLTVSGRVIINIEDGSNVTINGNAMLDVKGTYHVKSHNAIFESETDILLRAKNEINVNAKNITAHSEYDLVLNADNEFRTQSGKDTIQKSAGKYALNSAFDFNIESKANMNTYVDRNNSVVTLGSKLESVKINDVKLVDGMSRWHTKGDQQIETNGKLSYIIDGDANHEYNGNYSSGIKGNSITATQGNYSVSAKGTGKINTNGQLDLTSSSGALIKGSVTSVLANGVVTINGSTTSIQSGPGPIQPTKASVSPQSAEKGNSDSVPTTSDVLTLKPEFITPKLVEIPNLVTNMRIPFAGSSGFRMQDNTINYINTEKDWEDA